MVCEEVKLWTTTKDVSEILESLHNAEQFLLNHSAVPLFTVELATVLFDNHLHQHRCGMFDLDQGST